MSPSVLNCAQKILFVYLISERFALEFGIKRWPIFERPRLVIRPPISRCFDQQILHILWYLS